MTIGALVGALVATGVGLLKERLFETPDFGLQSRIFAPVTKVEASFTNVETGKVIPVPNPEALNPIHTRFINVDKRPLENLEIVLEFHAVDGTAITDQRYLTKPERGFGKLKIVEDGASQRRIQVALLIPGDEVEYSAMASRPVTILAYAKLPGLSFYQTKEPGCGFGI